MAKSEAMSKIEPLGDRIVVRPEQAKEKTEGGLYIPQQAQEKPVRGEVLAVGPGRTLRDGTVKPVAIEVGQTVVYAKWAGNELELEGEKYVLLREDDVLGIVRG